MIKPDYDKTVSKGLREEIDKYKIPLELIANIAQLPLSTLNDKLANKTPWRVKEVGLLAEYFGVSLDNLIIGVSYNKRKKITEVDTKNQIRDWLIQEKKYKFLGKLTAEGFFEEGDKK